MSKEPIDNVQWLDSASLNANDYNPNAVFSPELRLLERSILLTGWVQPILIDPDKRIIDGYHRHRLAIDSVELRRKYGGLAPCAVLAVTRPQAMLLTIRMNRAKGSHVAYRMSAIVRELMDEHGYDPAEISVEIGATADEIALLHQEGVFAQRNIKEYRYSRAWYPAETGSRPRARPA
jgi:ParB-like chromosome segregation protein Spo0J